MKVISDFNFSIRLTGGLCYWGGSTHKKQYARTQSSFLAFRALQIILSKRTPALSYLLFSHNFKITCPILCKSTFCCQNSSDPLLSCLLESGTLGLITEDRKLDPWTHMGRNICHSCTFSLTWVYFWVRSLVFTLIQYPNAFIITCLL